MAIEVTVRDTETGETNTATIENNYVLITAGTCYRSHISAYANGTNVVTVKGIQSPRPDEK